MKRIDAPVAVVRLRWLPSCEGGISDGPPRGPFATNCVFATGHQEENRPGWPWTAELMLTIAVEVIEISTGSGVTARIDFLARDLAEPHLRPGAEIVLMNGPKIIGYADILSTDREDIDGTETKD